MRLNLNPGPEKYVLAPGITITARPALSEVMEEAKVDDSLLAHADEIAGLIETEEGSVETVSSAMLKTRGKVGLLLAKAVARAVIEAWEGVEDPDGSPAPVSDDRVDAFLDIPAIYNAFTEVYLARWVSVQAEKNALSASPSGTSEEATTTAEPAQDDAEPAQPAKTGRKQ